MKIIQLRQHIENVNYQHCFEDIDHVGSGYSFPCEKDGSMPNFLERSATWRRNLTECLFGLKPVQYLGIQTYQWSYTEPAVGLCSCGEEVLLEGFTNTCERCGRDYNMSGQELAPRSQWGEETGESPSDILMIT